MNSALFRSYIEGIPFFIQPPTDGHLGCFHVLTVVHDVKWTQGYRHLFKILLSFPLDVFPEVTLLNHIIRWLDFYFGGHLFFHNVTSNLLFSESFHPGSLPDHLGEPQAFSLFCFHTAAWRCPSLEGACRCFGDWLSALELHSLRKHPLPWKAFLLSLCLEKNLWFRLKFFILQIVKPHGQRRKDQPGD